MSGDFDLSEIPNTDLDLDIDFEKEERISIQSEVEPSGDGYEKTDLANTRTFVKHWADKIRYCHDIDSWLAWDGKRWTPDENENIMELAKRTADQIFDDLKMIKNKDKLKDRIASALKAGSQVGMRAMVTLARSDPRITISIDELDSDPFLLNVLSGTLNLRIKDFSEILRPHRKEDYISNLIGIEFDSTAKCPEWTDFVNHIMAGNERLVKYLQTISGYGLTGEAIEEVLFVFHGTGGTGKSTYIETIREVLGSYCGDLPSQSLMRKKFDESPASPDLLSVANKRFLTIQETNRGQRWNEALIKRLTGGDMFTARKLYSNRFRSFRPQFKIFCATNHLPGTDSLGAEIKRRLKIIPFQVSIPEEDQDPRFKTNLRRAENLPGILNWLIEGCWIWQNEGLRDPVEVKEKFREYQDDNDILRDFIEECCVINPEVKIKAKDFNRAYKEWCQENNEKPRSSTFVGLNLRDKGFEHKKSVDWYWIGIGLKNEF